MIDGYMVLHINASLYIIYNDSIVPCFVREAPFRVVLKLRMFGQLSHFTCCGYFSSPEPYQVLCDCVGLYECGRCSTHIRRLRPQKE